MGFHVDALGCEFGVSRGPTTQMAGLTTISPSP